MIYVVWVADDYEEFGWFTVYPTKKQAMKHAMRFSVAKNVVYVSHKSWKHKEDYDATKTVVVEQMTSLYYGA